MRFRLICLILALCMFFSGCKPDAPCCKVTIVTNYNGYGIDGKPLRSGTFTKTFTVKAGDVFYESNDGKWVLNPENDDKNMGVIAEITAVDDKGVTAVIYGEEEVVKYDTGRKISSDMIIYDGPSYDYVMAVSGCSE